MSADTVIQKIEEKAKREVSEILEEGQARAEARHKEITGEAAKKAQKILQEAKDSAARQARSTVQKAELDARIQTLNLKRKLLDEVKTNAGDAFRKMPEADWAKLYTKLVLEACMPGEVGVCVPESEAKRYQDPEFCKKNGLEGKGTLLEYWSALLTEKAGEPCGLFLTDYFADFEGGLRLCGKEYDIDLSYDALLSEVFEKNEKALADCLFETGEDAR